MSNNIAARDKELIHKDTIDVINCQLLLYS